MLDDNLALIIWLHRSLRNQCLFSVDWSMLVVMKYSGLEVFMGVVVEDLPSQSMVMTGQALGVAVESVGCIECRVWLVQWPIRVLLAEGGIAV